MASLFEPVTAGALKLSNRIVMAPLTRNRSPQSVPNDLNITYYEQRSSAGLIISEGTAISQQGQGYADVPGLYKPEQLAGWRRVTDAVHQRGGTIVTQLWHVGRVSHTTLQPNGDKPVAPSAIRANSKTFIINGDGSGEFTPTSEPRALDKSEIADIVATFGKAAKAAVETAGFDGVEIHGANGYLVDQFLRSGSNHRDDEYGGSVENRARFLFEVLDAVTAGAGAGKAGIRLSPVTPANDASDPDPQPLFDYVAERLAGYDLAYVHIIEGSTGGPRDFQQGPEPFDYARLKQIYRDAGGKAAWMVNNGYDRELAEEAVESGKADLVAFGKPFIANPDLVKRLKENADLNELDPKLMYGGGAKGYTDYPILP